MRYSSYLCWFFLALLLSCEKNPTESNTNPLAKTISNKTDPDFKEYWYQGRAEISTYKLEQNRYQDLHPGQTTLIFVTEDFLTDEQVKNDTYTQSNSTSVLKTNLINRFTTGIYDYSIMTSVFTPVNTQKFPHTLKTTTSSQDWCGQSWMQVNKKGKQYLVQQRSYFEKEGDRNLEVPVRLLEDEILNRIRINPAALPQGELKIIPSNQYLRLAHQPTQEVSAMASIQDYNGEQFSGDALKQYSIQMPSLQRELTFIFSGKSPYLIEGWIDQYPSAFDQKLRKTLAQRQTTVMEPYWQQNSPTHQEKRAKLGLNSW